MPFLPFRNLRLPQIATRRAGLAVFVASVVLWTGLGLLWGTGALRSATRVERTRQLRQAARASAELSIALEARMSALRMLGSMPSILNRTEAADQALAEYARRFPEADRVELVEDPRRWSMPTPNPPVYLAERTGDGTAWVRAVLKPNWTGRVFGDANPFTPENSDRRLIIASPRGARTPCAIAPPDYQDLVEEANRTGEDEERHTKTMRWGDGRNYLTAVFSLRPFEHRPPLLVVSAVPNDLVRAEVSRLRRGALALGFLFGVVTGIAGMLALRWATRRLRRANDELERRVEERTAELMETERSLRGIFENVPLGLYQCDPQGRFVRANPKLAEILGYESVEAMVEGLGSLQALGDPELRGTFLARLRRGGTASVTTSARTADGRTVWIAESARAVFDNDGEILMLEGTVGDVTEQRALEDTLRHMVATDPLTGLLNRRGLEEAVVEAPTPMAVIALDVDRFKCFNDTYGHPAGDRALQAVAEAIRATVRAGDIVARAGGEEFTVVLPHTGIEGARTVAEAIRLAVAAYDLPEARLTISAGVATAANPTEVAEAFAAADRALYLAKERGRNRVVVNPAKMA
jgi:diguanylate cyclase (GGDEF)-like protein/PAS domain S-box-containing protein